jgi:arylsulfatase
MVDTLRARELGVYGTQITKTPAIDAFAAESELFERATSPAPSTRASIASLMTGVSPAVHGVESGLHGLLEGTEALIRLPELLRAAGYLTAALVANPNVDPAFGFQRGFDVYKRLYRLPEIQRPPSSLDLTYTAPMMVDEVKQFLQTLPAEQPFFLFVLTIDPHGPYTPPPPYDSMYDARAAGGDTGMMKNLLDIDRQLEAGEPAALELPLALYRGEVSYGDLAFGQFMNWLKSRELLDDTVVVFTSDHGEAFAEHGNRGHGKTIYQETIHIPLIIRQPKFFAPDKRNRANVDLTDLSTTIVGLAGAELPAHWTGRDLRDANPDKAIFALSHQPGYATTSVTAGNYKMIENELDDSSELFDLGADPGEQHPLDQSSHKKTMEIMTAALAHFRDSSAATRDRMITGQRDLGTNDIPEDIREQLESLGYID